MSSQTLQVGWRNPIKELSFLAGSFGHSIKTLTAIKQKFAGTFGKTSQETPGCRSSTEGGDWLHWRCDIRPNSAASLRRGCCPLTNTTVMDTLWRLPINHSLFDLLDLSAALTRAMPWDVTLMIMLHYTRLCCSRQETPSLALKMWAAVLWESLWVGHWPGLWDTSSCGGPQVDPHSKSGDLGNNNHRKWVLPITVDPGSRK